MGYYNRNYTGGRTLNVWYFLLGGVVLGVLIMVLVYPVAGDRDAVMQTADDTQTDSNSSDVKQGGAPEGIQQTSFNVTTQVTDVVNQVAPSVVGVINIQRQEDFWSQQSEGMEAGTGSGVIYKRDGDTVFIVTNHHVIEGADTVEVVLSDETHLEAEVVGSDLFSDLAVLKMDGQLIDQTITIGSSEDLNVGEPAIAIGNPLGMAFSGSVTQGVISGKQRTVPQDFNMDGRADWQAEVIQTDAAINPGNSGGALINIEGQLIGINSMKINEQDVEGIAFAIPIDSALPTIRKLEEKGEVTRPYMGVEIYSLDEVPQAEWDATLNLPEDVTGGVYVWSVERLSPAEQSGMQQLDVITELDGKPIMNMIDLRKILYYDKDIGDDVEVTYYRNGKQQKTTIKLGVQ